MKPVREVRTDFEDQNVVTIDCYLTDHPDEQGKVAGFVDLDTGKVIYVDALLMNDPLVKEAVDEVIATRLNDNVLLIELPADYIRLEDKQAFNQKKQGRNIFGWPDKYPCFAVYVKTELNPNGKDEEIYDFLYPKTYPK